MPDVMPGIVEVLHLVTALGDTVVVSCPVYPPGPTARGCAR